MRVNMEFFWLYSVFQVVELIHPHSGLLNHVCVDHVQGGTGPQGHGFDSWLCQGWKWFPCVLCLMCQVQTWCVFLHIQFQTTFFLMQGGKSYNWLQGLLCKIFHICIRLESASLQILDFHQGLLIYVSVLEGTLCFLVSESLPMTSAGLTWSSLVSHKL